LRHKQLFSVTEGDIDGACQSSTGCPVARALRRIFSTDNVQVRARDCSINGVIYDLPDVVYLRVKSYDFDNFMLPMTCKWEEIENGTCN